MSTNRDRNLRIPNAPLVPTPNPNVTPVGRGLLGSVATLYTKLMGEMLDGDVEGEEQDVLVRATQLYDPARNLDMLLAQHPGFDGPDTEIYLQGKMDVFTSSPEVVAEVMKGQELDQEPNPEGPPYEVSFHVPQGDAIQCFFRSVDVGPAIVEDLMVPYALGFHVTNALITPADSAVPPLFIQGSSSVYPADIDRLVMGLVQAS